MTQVTKLKAADGLHLAATVYGEEDSPPALLVHGMGQTRQSWGVAGQKLAAQGWHAHAVDLRGHGDSDWPEEVAYDQQDVARDIIELCQNFDKPPLLVGASMGGSSALAAQATRREQLYCGLIIVDIAPDLDMEGGRRIVSFMAANPNGFADLEEAADFISAYRGGQRKPSATGLARVLRKHQDGRWRWHWDPRMIEGRKTWLNDPVKADEYAAELRRGMISGTQKLTAPTLLVRGGSSDVVSPDAARALLEYLPNAKFVDVADATHMVAGDQNDAFTQAVLDFARPLVQQ